MFVTIENVGNVPIILSSYGRKYNENNTIMKDIQEFLDGKDEFIMIKPNEAKVVTYKYNFGSPFKKMMLKFVIHLNINYLLKQSLSVKIL